MFLAGIFVSEKHLFLKKIGVKESRVGDGALNPLIVTNNDSLKRNLCLNPKVLLEYYSFE
jgi:hypothetical protein